MQAFVLVARLLQKKIKGVKSFWFVLAIGFIIVIVTRAENTVVFVYFWLMLLMVIDLCFMNVLYFATPFWICVMPEYLKGTPSTEHRDTAKYCSNLQIIKIYGLKVCNCSYKYGLLHCTALYWFFKLFLAMSSEIGYGVTLKVILQMLEILNKTKYAGTAKSFTIVA